jgi:DNA-directed RNA polymerase subunit RPC12/RpoP
MTVHQMRIGPPLQYFCSSCDKILKNSTTLEVQSHQIKEEEECPSCGALLLDTLQNRMGVSIHELYIFM